MSKPSAAQQTSRAIESTRKGVLGLSALPDRSTPAGEPGGDGQQAVELPSEATPEGQAASNNSEDTQGVKQSSVSLELAESQCPAGDVCPETAGSSASGQEGGPEHEGAVLDHSSPRQQQPGSPASPEEALSLGLQWLQSIYSGSAEEAMDLPRVQDSLHDFKSLLLGMPFLPETTLSFKDYSCMHTVTAAWLCSHPVGECMDLSEGLCSRVCYSWGNLQLYWQHIFDLYAGLARKSQARQLTTCKICVCYYHPCKCDVDVHAGLPPHLQAELVLMSPSMVSESLHSELAPVLALGILGQPGATGQTGSDGEPYGFREPARIPALAAMCQIRPTQPDACASTLGALCMVRPSFLLRVKPVWPWTDPGQNVDGSKRRKLWKHSDGFHISGRSQQQ